MLWVLSAVLFLFLLSGAALCRYALHGRRKSVPESVAWAKEHVPFLPDIGALEPVDLPKAGSGTLRGYFLRCGGDAKGCVVITHGYTDTHIGALKYAKVYLDLGYDCLVYDLRGHGDNPREACTYSVRESADLDAIIRFVRERTPVVGLHGESLGAAATAAAMKYRPDVAFAVCDCGFCDIMPIFKAGLKTMHIPAFFVHAASLIAWLFHGVSFEDMRPLDALGPDVRVPMLFIHGEKDIFIFPEHSRRMHQAVPGSRMALIPGAAHAASVLTDPEAYTRVVREFVADVEKGAD